MRKLMVLLTVMMAVLCFTAAGFAAQLTCHNCKCTLRDIPCATDSQGVTGTCAPFDFDANTQGSGSYDGYVQDYNLPKWCKAIFAICDCPDPTQFVNGLRVQVKQEILVSLDGTSDPVAGDHGAYWSGPAPGAITFRTYPTLLAACDDTTGTATLNTFGAQTYYLSDGVTVGTPYTGNACAIDTANRVTVLLSDETTPYTVNSLTDGSYWAIDIPPIRIAPAAIAQNAIIYVKITLVSTTATTICAECTLCDCIIAVAKVCPTGPAKTYTLTFPYFTSLLPKVEDSDYWNGMVIGNSSSTDGSCELKAYQVDSTAPVTGTLAVKKNSIKVTLVDAIDWTGTVNGKSAYITATCTFSSPFGFGMMSDDTASMGYLPWTVLP